MPHGHWKTTTFVAGLRLTGMTAPLVVDGAMNGDVFLAYVEQVLVPDTAAGRHRDHGQSGEPQGRAVREAIEAAGASFGSCRPTVPTSIRSRTPSPSSRHSPARQSRANNHGLVGRTAGSVDLLHPSRMRQLLRRGRIRRNLIRNGSSPKRPFHV